MDITARPNVSAGQIDASLDITATRDGQKNRLDVTPRLGANNLRSGSAWFQYTVQSTPDYSDGDMLGSAIEITSLFDDAGGKGIVMGVMIIDADKIKPDLDIYLFEGPGTPVVLSADNGAFDVALATAKTIQGIIPIRLGNWFVGNSVNIGFAPISGVSPFSCAQLVGAASGTTSLWLQLVARGTLNFATTTALSIKLLLKRE